MCCGDVRCYRSSREHIAQCTEKRHTQSTLSASIAIFVITFATNNGSSFHDVSIEICDLESHLCINQCTIKMHLFCELQLFHMDVLCVFFSLSLWNDSVCVFFVCFLIDFFEMVRSQMTVTNFEIYSKNQVKRMCNVWRKTAIENKCIFAVIVRISTLQHFYLVLQINILRLASCKLLCFRFFLLSPFPSPSRYLTIPNQSIDK